MWLRRDLVQALVMADGKDRQKAFTSFDEWLNAPADGWDAADQRLRDLIHQA
ncbi:hypothetical protein [Micromonospora wenchangensis]|uniref:hypothetical protein n=1 Tax=Micromonospora wenchangensis TaxID=1185415 RepID=UPI003809DBE3